MTQAEEFVQSQGIQYTTSGDELIMACPSCGKDKHFYVNRFSGLGNCKVCSFSPNLFKLKQHFGVIATVKEPEVKTPLSSSLDTTVQLNAIKYHRDLFNDPDKVRELTEWWGISEKILKEYFIGICEYDRKLWVSIPTLKDGIVWNIKYRTWNGFEKEFRREFGGTSMLYNIEKFETMNKYVLLLEGEKDALTLIDKGVPNVLGNSGGAATFLPEWIKMFDKFEKIFICYDMDEAGDSGARKLIKRLGTDKCYRVSLPGAKMDINDYFKEGHTTKEFVEILKKAQLFEIPGVITLDDSYSRLMQKFEDGEFKPAVTTPWPKVNTMLNGGFFEKQLITISGQAKSLKTHISYIIAEHAAKQGIPVFIYELEMDPAELAKRNVTRTQSVPYAIMDTLDVMMTRMEQQNLPIYIGEPYGITEYKQVIETIREVYKRFGIGFVVVDHAHLLERHIDNLVQRMAVMVREFAYLAKELEIPILLLAQPNKSKDTRKRDTYQNIGWSNTFATDSDVILIIHRNRAEQIDPKSTEQQIINSKYSAYDPESMSFSPVATLYVDASRTSLGGMTRLWCDPLYFSVEELAEEGFEKEEVDNIKKGGYIDTEYAFEM